MITLIGLKTCSTCKKVEKQLEKLNIDYIYQDVRKKQPTSQQIEGWLLNIPPNKTKKIVNTSGNKYKELGLKDTWNTLSLKEQIAILSSDGMLIKRPILEMEHGILVGREVSEYLTKVESE